MPHLSPGHRLRALMSRPNQTVMMPGAFNALCAKAIADAGFDAAYISGAATSVSAGVPDVGILTLDHFVRQIREAFDASNLPIIADADTGFGESEMVRRTVIEYARAGAAGLHIEDQVFPKRCGHLDGKKLVPLDHACEKIRAAVKAARDVDASGIGCRVSGFGSDADTTEPPSSSTRNSQPATRNPSPAFLICARTDARGVEGFEAAISRATAYLNAGADMIFPEGLQSEQEFADFAKALRHSATPPLRHFYLLANMTEFGKTPIIPAQRFAEMGYNVVIFPVSMLRIAMGAVTSALAALKRDGSVQSVVNQMQTREQLYKTIGYTPGVEWEFSAR